MKDKKKKIFLLIFVSSLSSILYLSYKIKTTMADETTTVAGYSYGFETNRSGYLPYCNGVESGTWTTYPITPPSNSGACLPKRYCSDLRCREYAAGEFKRDSSCNIEFNSEESDVDGACSTSGIIAPIDVNHLNSNLYGNEDVPVDYTAYCIEVTTETSGDKISRCTWEFRKYDTAKGKCHIIKKTPNILENYSKATLYYPTANGLSGTDGNCFYKSCKDLTILELKSIYSQIWGGYTQSETLALLSYCSISTNKDSEECLSVSKNNYPVFYKFCEPYIYSENISILGENIKYLPNDSLDKKDIFCNQFKFSDDADGKFFEYIIKYGDSYDKDTSTVYSNNDEDVYYECKLHECPLTSINSKNCSSNYYLFYNRNQNYLDNYEKFVLKNENKTSPKRTTECSTIACNDKIVQDQVNCPSNAGNYVMDDLCDIYNGYDKTYGDTPSNIANLPIFSDLASDITAENGNDSNTNSEIQNILINDTDLLNNASCTAYSNRSTASYCYKSYDCGLNPNYPLCKTEKEEAQTNDSFNYYFRPVPPSSSTEVIGSDTKIRRWLFGENEADKHNSFNYSCSHFDYWSYLTNDLIKQEDYTVNSGINYFDINEKKVCGSSSGFKKFGLYERESLLSIIPGIPGLYDQQCITTGDIDMGYYYNGLWKISEFAKMPHIVRLCDGIRLGVSGYGRDHTCGNSGYICNKPYWDSYYIDNSLYDDNGIEDSRYIKRDSVDGRVTEINLKVCLRMKNIAEPRSCGTRECRVDCVASVCETQWCGNDRCIDLKLSEENGFKDSKEVTNNPLLGGSSVIFRGIVKNGKAYVFLDATSLGCIGLGDAANNRDITSEEDRYRSPGTLDSTVGGTIRGRIRDGKYLFDDNSLTDNNCDGKITDDDVFGERLYSILNCNSDKGNIDKQDDWCYNGNDPTIRSKKTGYRNSKCDSLSIGDENYRSPDNGIFVSDHFTWDIVQYIGNNQIDNISSKCSTGSSDIQKCRGNFIYDNSLGGSKESSKQKFVNEMQGIDLPLTAGPIKFFKYATIENSPNLFVPFIELFAFQNSYGGTYITLNSTTKDKANLNFFNPKIQIEYNGKYLYIDIPFTEIENDGYIDTVFLNENLRGFFVFKKSAFYTSGEPTSSVCLFQKTSCNSNGVCIGADRQVKCLSRSNPYMSSFLIKPYDINSSIPTVKAYFYNTSSSINPPLSSMAPGNIVGNLNDSDKFSKFFIYDNLEGSIGDSYSELLSDKFAFNQHYPIYLSSSDCSDIYYDCIKTKRLLLDEMDKEFPNSVLVEQYKNKLSVCENQKEVTCSALNGNEINTVIFEGENLIPIKIKENYSTDGAYNQICATKGFEGYPIYVKALPSGSDYLGKCILDENSKKNILCKNDRYYEFCKGNSLGVPSSNCKCFDGTTSCNCSDGKSCYRVIDCSCSGDSCFSLPEACFKSGFNMFKSSLDKDGKIQDSCNCLTNDEEIPDSYTHDSIRRVNIEYRKATPRELGLCANLRDIDFCNAVKYYDRNNIYYDGGEGFNLGFIKNNKFSNIWRTNQKMYGLYYFGDLGHAEFDKTTDCKIGQTNELSSDLCLLNKNTSDNKYYGYGQCKGFWKNKDNIKPLATCTTDINGVSMFGLKEGTGCIRYSCPEIGSERGAILSTEIEAQNYEKNANNFDKRGLFNGYAIWDEYQKGTDFDTSDKYKTKTNGTKFYYESDYQKVDSYTNDKGTEGYAIKGEAGWENGHGDDIEIRQAKRCLNGYGPAGFNTILKDFMPVVTTTDDSLDFILGWNSNEYNKLLLAQDNIIKNMIGYNLNKSLIREATSQSALDYLEYSSKMSYYGADNLPVRYCNQTGGWSSVEDIYSKYKVVGYYPNNSILHDLDNKGLIKQTNINVNNFDNYYGNKYCERLYCQSITEEDVGLLSIEDLNIDTSSCQNKYSIVGDSSLSSIKVNDSCYFAKGISDLNYPKDKNNSLDLRNMSINNNKYTYWRHAGGAIWSETPAPRFVGNDFNSSVEKVGIANGNPIVNGTCIREKNFYPSNVKFASTFQEQFDKLDKTNANASNWNVGLKTYDVEFRENGTIFLDKEPSRYCSKWGLWSPIQNKCASACEAIDPFRTKFADITGGNGGVANGLLENYEITKLSKIPTFRNDYCSIKKADNTFEQKTDCNSTYDNSTVKYGDIYTGGAKWPRSKSGTRVFGTCDSTVGVNCNYGSKYYGTPSCSNPNTGWVSGFSDRGAQFLQGSNGLSLNDNRPYRDCLADGTWGPVKNPCVNFLTCPDKRVQNGDIILSGVANGDTIGTLEGGNITYEDAKNAAESTETGAVQTIQLSLNCNANPVFLSGTVTNTCNITTGSWENDLKSSCILKTCPAESYVLGNLPNGLDIANIPADKYYAKESGYSGEIQIGGKQYLGYTKTVSCPSGYIYKSKNSGTETNLTYNCKIDSDINSSTYNQAIWETSGYCVPIACKWGDLLWTAKNITNSAFSFNSGINFNAKGIIYPFGNNTENVCYGQDTYKVYGTDAIAYYITYGSQINMSNVGSSACKDKYVLDGDDIVTTCSEDSNAVKKQNGKWTYTGGTCKISCSKAALDVKIASVAGSKYYIDSLKFGMQGKSYKNNAKIDVSSISSIDYTEKPNSLYFSSGISGETIPSGTFIEATCNTGYAETGNKINGADYSGSEKPIPASGSVDHHYYCEDGNWKVVGGCYKNCNSASFGWSVGPRAWSCSTCSGNIKESGTISCPSNVHGAYCTGNPTGIAKWYCSCIGCDDWYGCDYNVYRKYQCNNGTWSLVESSTYFGNCG